MLWREMRLVGGAGVAVKPKTFFVLLAVCVCVSAFGCRWFRVVLGMSGFRFPNLLVAVAVVANANYSWSAGGLLVTI